MNALLPLVLLVGLVQVTEPPSATRASLQTCELRGRITDKETGLPISGAVVQISMVDGKLSLAARADEEGRYRFSELPPGPYSGFVEPGDFRATHLSGSLGPFRGIVLKAGDVRADVDVALVRARALTVRVVDEEGVPLAGLLISVNSVVDGRNVNHNRFRAGTDDRGRHRVYRLPPGRYVVCAEPGAAAVSAAAGPARRERFLRTCYPSAATAAQAEPVQLERSDIEDLEIRMRRGRTYLISGTVLDSSGTPAPGAMVSLSRFERNSSSGIGIKVEGEGRFTVANVEPGDYAIEASVGGPHRPEQRRELEEAYVPVHVDSSDAADLVVSMAKAVEVAGRITLEDPAVPFARAPGYAPLLIHARLTGDQLPGTGSARGGHAGDDRVFYLGGIFGRRTLEVANVPRGWYVKSIRYEGKEIIDLPTEFKASRDPSLLEIVLSTRGAVVSGRVLDERGEPVRGARVVLLPANPARWNRFELTNVGTSSGGAFRLGPQRGGDYLAVALDPSAPAPDPGNRERLALLAKGAERITLNENEERTLDLRVVTIR